MFAILKSVLKVFAPFRIAVVVSIAVFFLMLFLGDQGLLQLNKLLVMKNRLTEQQLTLKTDIDRLIRERELLHEPKYLELVIRKELGYIKPGEIVYQEKSE